MNWNVAQIGRRKLTVPGGGQKEFDKRRGLFPAALLSRFLPIADQFFKLVDNDQQALSRTAVLAYEVRQAEAAGPEGRKGIGLGYLESSGKLRGKVTDGIAAGTENYNGPIRPAKVTALECRQEARADE